MKALGFWKALWELFFGVEYKFYVNHGSKEIHNIAATEKRCQLDKITRHEWVTEGKANKLLRKGYNGCRYCWTEKDKG